VINQKSLVIAMNTDQTKGKLKQLTGEIKRKWGQLTDDDLRQAQGSMEKLIGKIQERSGDRREEIAMVQGARSGQVGGRISIKKMGEGRMKGKSLYKLAAPAVLLGLAMAMPAFGQNESSHDAMHSAGENMKQAGSDTAAAAEDAYTGAKRAVKDVTITAKVKKALHDDPAVGASDIHVSTKTGVVTLAGQVSSREAAARAEDLAAHADGVKHVNNQLMVTSAARTTD
jgi:osmotically-inducible protein OsmY